MRLDRLPLQVQLTDRWLSFGSKHFSFDAGYAVLFGMAPKPSEIAEAKQPEGATQSPTMFTKRVLQLMKRDRMVSSE